MNASDVMTSGQVWFCSPQTTAREIASQLCQNDIGSMPVCDRDGKIQGMVTDRDICCRCVAQGLSLDTPASRLMSSPVQTVHEDSDLREVELIMERYKIRRVPVVDDQKRLVGFISMADLARECIEDASQEHEVVEVLEVVSQPG